MSELPKYSGYLIPAFARENAIPHDQKQAAQELSMRIGMWIEKTPFLPPIPQDVNRYRRIPKIIRFADDAEYDTTVIGIISSDKGAAPPPSAAETRQLLDEASIRRDLEDTSGVTIFGTDADEATAIVMRRPGGKVTEQIFLNTLAEEFMHAATPRRTALEKVKNMVTSLRMSDVDFMEHLTKYFKNRFLEEQYPHLILDAERELFAGYKHIFGSIETSLGNLFFRGLLW